LDRFWGKKKEAGAHERNYLGATKPNQVAVPPGRLIEKLKRDIIMKKKKYFGK